ncbi:MAG: hypothetical protein IT168_00970 [Bryobacterales bacterium]|nr:hypothetical protein [Bryobacterales bacterium]
MRLRDFPYLLPLCLSLTGVAYPQPATRQNLAQAASMTRPRAGRPEILPVTQVKPGMQAIAWTVFAGSEPEAVPIEIIGLMKNAWGPKQDIILGKMGGKAQRTNVAGGMSGSPVYINGKLIGAVSLRMSVFSPDAICGITPIELMLEINDYDKSTPAEARTPDKVAQRAQLNLSNGLVSAAVAAGASLTMTPIDTPLVFSGFQEGVLREFSPMFQQMGVTVAQGGASSTIGTAKPAAGWQNSLNPGDAVSGVLVSGDMSMTAMGTVTYNDGKRVLAFGHPFLSLGSVSMPMAKSEVVMTLASAFQPNKFGNATEIVGALKQDRHSGIMGVLGEQSDMIPCRVKVRTFTDDNKVLKEKDLRFQVFVQQRWTPFLMMATLFNSVSQLNDFTDEVTYRFTGAVELEGNQKISLTNLFAPAELPVPVPMLVAGWWGDKFNRLFSNPVRTPRLKNVDVTLDLLPQRRIAAIETAFAEKSEVDAGADLPVRVILRPYRGGRIERQVTVHIPAGFPKGEHRILLSDADSLNRLQLAAGMMNRFMDLPQTVSLLNQERTNDKLYVSLIQARPTVYYDDKTLPSLPASVANVMQTGRSASRAVFQTPETAEQQQALPFDSQVTGSYSLRIRVN